LHHLLHLHSATGFGQAGCINLLQEGLRLWTQGVASEKDGVLTELRLVVLELVVERWPVAFGQAQIA